MAPGLVVGIGLASRPILQPQPALAAAAAIYKPFLHFLQIGKLLLSAKFENREIFSRHQFFAGNFYHKKRLKIAG